MAYIEFVALLLSHALLGLVKTSYFCSRGYQKWIPNILYFSAWKQGIMKMILPRNPENDHSTQLTLTCLKSEMETLEKGVKYVQR